MRDPTNKPNDYRDHQDLVERVDLLEQIISSSVLIVDDPSMGLVLRSPNLHYWRLTVSDMGFSSWADLGTDRPH